MKKNYFLKAVFTLLLCSFFSLSYAADWYISATGNDETGDGSVALPWASFSKAQDAATAGDVIHVSGMINMWSDPANTTFTALASGNSTTNKTGITIAKSLTIQGTTSATDGFNGTNESNNTRIFQILSDITVTIKNLKIANALINSNTGAGGESGGAIRMTSGKIIAENVVFDSNTATGHNNSSGAALYIEGTNTAGTSFKNCVFTNNAANRAGAIYINNWGGVVTFENCSFIGNESKITNGGSALFIRSGTNNTTCNIINSTFRGNKVLSTGNGGTIYLGAKAMASTNVNIINCTITENTTAGATANCAGVHMLNTTANCIGNLYIQNTIIEGNTAADGSYADLSVAAISPTAANGGSSTVPGFIKIENSIVGRHGTPSERIPAANVPAPNHFNYLTATSNTNDLKAGLAPFNTTTKTYSLYVGSAAIDFGNSALLSTYSSKDQLGNTRPFTDNKCFAGAWESAAIATTTPSAPTALVATAGDGQISVAFKTAATGGSLVTNYKYSVNNGEYVACDPAVTAGPIVITGLANNTEYTVKLKAVNANGESAESVASNAVTPTGTTGVDNILNKITIFRSPNNQIVVNNASQKAGTITVCNAIGQRVASVALNASTTTINKSLTSGVYLVLVTVDGKTGTTKIIL